MKHTREPNLSLETTTENPVALQSQELYTQHQLSVARDRWNELYLEDAQDLAASASTRLQLEPTGTIEHSYVSLLKAERDGELSKQAAIAATSARQLEGQLGQASEFAQAEEAALVAVAVELAEAAGVTIMAGPNGPVVASEVTPLN